MSVEHFLKQVGAVPRTRCDRVGEKDFRYFNSNIAREGAYQKVRGCPFDDMACGELSKCVLKEFQAVPFSRLFRW